MKILVTGAYGQLGRELCQLLGPAAIPIDIDTLDLTDCRAVEAAIPALGPDAVIDCAAYTQVDQAENDAERCRAVNVLAVEHLARACRRLDCPLVQISTDYIFCGRREPQRPWCEDDRPEPQGVYAITKLEGERAAAAYAKHLIVRTCGLYARPSHEQAKNFVKTILRLARTKPKLRVVNDQHCTPSYVPHVARAVLYLLGAESGEQRAESGEQGAGSRGPHLSALRSSLFALRPAPWGTYHVTNRGATTWHEMACEIVRLARLSVPVEPISTAEFAAAAPRPAYSVLDTTAYHRLGGPTMPDWKQGLAEYFAELKELWKHPTSA